MITRRAISWLVCVFLLTIAPHTVAAASGEEAFRGKVIRIVVGFSPGGGFDTFARAVARYMGKHVPGNPTVMVENMTGAGSLIAANHIYKVAKPDGLTVGAFNGNQILAQLVGGQGIAFDARKMEWIGAPGYNHDLCLLSQKAGVGGAEQWLASKTQLKLGGSAPGSPTDDVAKVLKEAIGLPIRLITGYKGTADVRLAAESGEIAGGCWGWDSVSVTWRKALDTGDAVVVLQANRRNHPDLPTIPQAIKFAKTEEGRKMIDVGIHGDSDIVRTYTLPPGTPKDRVQALRKAFDDTLKDPEFVADAKKSRLNIGPIPVEDIEKDIAGLFKLDPALLSKLKDVLYN